MGNKETKDIQWVEITIIKQTNGLESIIFVIVSLSSNNFTDNSFFFETQKK